MEERISRVVTLEDVSRRELARLVARLGLRFNEIPPGAPILGSYWGEPEAGLVGDELHVRGDTPLHSVLHEASHYVCMAGARRRRLHRDAGGDDLEECAVCYLQILLADHVRGVGRERMCRDMDLWGYRFRRGSTETWFREDAEDARRWLSRHGLVDEDETLRFRLRD